MRLQGAQLALDSLDAIDGMLIETAAFGRHCKGCRIHNLSYNHTYTPIGIL